MWIEKNLPEVITDDLLDQKSPYEIGLKIEKEKYRHKYYNYLNKRAYEIIYENPSIVFKEVINGFLHFSVLNPFLFILTMNFIKIIHLPKLVTLFLVKNIANCTA